VGRGEQLALAAGVSSDKAHNGSRRDITASVQQVFFMTRTFSTVALVLLASTTWAQNRGPLELADAVVPAAQRISYGTDPLQFGELRLPSARGPHPIAIVIHGGCWVSALGTLAPRAVAMDNMRPLAAALTEQGIATWNIEYRRLGNDGGGWPGSFRDIAAAADFVRNLAKDHPLDLKRVVAIGHSAGGHFAMWLAGRSKIPAASDLYISNPLPLTGVVNLDGPADLKAALAVQQSICGRPAITEVIGGSPEEKPDRYKHGSPIELLPLGVPQVFFAGRMFNAQVQPFTDAANRAGDTVRAFPNPNLPHFVFIDPLSDVGAQAIRSVRQLLSMPD
jgi:acetyl esterase/lipase